MSDRDLYTIGEVAAILGVSAHTIRAWERRHGIVKPLRTQSRQRRYRAEDLDLLRDVKRAIDVEGMSLKLAFRTVSGEQHPAETRTQRFRLGARARQLLIGTGGVWRAVADMLPELIMVVNLSGEIVECNVTAARTFGMTRQRLVGRSFPDLVDAFDRAKAVLLYRPQPRTVKAWEINLTTEVGSRLYSFQSWPVSNGEERYLALVGTEMFVAAPSRLIEAEDTTDIATQADRETNAELVNASSFQRLVDELPLGLAVTTVGREPRVVYANVRLMKTLGRPAAGLTGQPIRDLVANPTAVQTLQQVVQTKRGETLRALPDTLASEAQSQRRFLNLAFRPLFSSSRRVTSVLVVVDDATADVTWRMQLEKLVADQRIDRAGSAEELVQLGLEYLARLTPRFEFAIAVAAPPATGGSPYAVASTPGWKALAADLETGRVGAVLRDSAASGKRLEVDTTQGRLAFHVTAVPLLVRGADDSRRTLGAVAWRRPSFQPMPYDQLSAVEAFVGLLAFAAELLHVRTEALHKASQLEAIVGAASLVPLSDGSTGLGVRFLERLTHALRADRAAIGRVVGSRFVVEVGYDTQGALVKPGDRLSASGHVLESVRSGEPVARSGPNMPDSRKRKRAVAQLRHKLSVPLVLAAKVVAVITLERVGDVPFDAEEVRLVQTLSSVGLLAVSLARRDSSPI
jgi:PAS domain S-box-containing protein